MTNRRGAGVKPLAMALAVALGTSAIAANADASTTQTFNAQMQAFKHAVAQIKQDYAQHPQQFSVFPNVHAHKISFPRNRGQRQVSAAATFAVTSCTDDASSATTVGSLRYAVLNAVNGDTINLSACNNSTITLTQGALHVAVADDLSITAGAGNHVTIDGNGTDRVFYLTGLGYGTTNVVALSNLTIRNGKSPIITIGSPASSIAAGGCVFSAVDGIALYNSTVTGCQAVNPGGSAEGGGILASGGLYMQACTISNNVVSGVKGSGTSTYTAIGGGAVSPEPAYIYNSHIDGNSVTLAGGGNVASAGGLLAEGAKIYASTISNNTVRLSAGSSTSEPYIAAAGGLSIKYNTRTKTIGLVFASTISGNSVECTSTLAGGGPPNAFCLGGGAISSIASPGTTGSLEIAYSTISGNHSDFIGGGVLSKYSLNLAQSTISGNSALGGAGLVQKYIFNGKAAIYNSTIAANAATYAGGGIFDNTGGLLGPATAPAPMNLVSSIVATNTAGNAGADIYLASGYNLTIAGSNDLVMAATSNVTLPTGTLAADPLLAPLANNGGPTQTMGLNVGSPALSVGSNPNGYATDQRGPGFPRTTGGLTDIGAFQGTLAAVAPIAAVPTPTLSTWALALLAGLLGLFGWRRRRTQ